jgi:hypothetical protein
MNMRLSVLRSRSSDTEGSVTMGFPAGERRPL